MRGRCCFGLATIAVWAAACGEAPAVMRLDGPRSLVILHSADTHSQLFPYARVLSSRDQERGLGPAATLTEIGGFARLATRLREERLRAPLVMHVDSGDAFQGSLTFVQHEGEPELKALSALGVDAQAVGNHELDEGPELFRESYSAFARFPLLAANYASDGEGGVASPRPFAVVDAGGLLVGVIGVGNVTSVAALRERPNGFEIVARDATRSVQGHIDFLRPLVDVVVAVTHLGLSGDEALVRETSGLDAVLGGHQHIVLDEPRFIDDCAGGVVADGFGFSRRCSPRRVPIVHSGAYTEYLGRLTLSLDDRGFAFGPSYDPLDAHEVIAAEYDPLPLSDDVPQDPALAALLAPYAPSHFLEARLGVLGYAPSAIPRAGVTGADSALGNLAARAARVFAMADLSVIGASGLRRDVAPGLLDEEGIFRALPFDDAVVVVRVTGAELLGALSRAAELAAERDCATPVHVDGIRAELDCPCEEIPCVRAAALPSGVMCARDEDCVALGGFCDRGESATGRCFLPIAPVGSYELATTAYLARGAHGLFPPRNEREWVEIAPNLARAVVERLRGGPPCAERVDGTCSAGCAAAFAARAEERCAAGKVHPMCAGREAACEFALKACLALPCLDAARGAERDGRLVFAKAAL